MVGFAAAANFIVIAVSITNILCKDDNTSHVTATGKYINNNMYNFKCMWDNPVHGENYFMTLNSINNKRIFKKIFETSRPYNENMTISYDVEIVDNDYVVIKCKGIGKIASVNNIFYVNAANNKVKELESEISPPSFSNEIKELESESMSPNSVDYINDGAAAGESTATTATTVAAAAISTEQLVDVTQQSIDIPTISPDLIKMIRNHPKEALIMAITSLVLIGCMILMKYVPKAGRAIKQRRTYNVPKNSRITVRQAELSDEYSEV
ncbi:MAG: hypothetical protein KDH96_05890 [Candidatus Riesia sp.]|nr:hypothetical protein [Candidatus Riesia sp.]